MNDFEKFQDQIQFIDIFYDFHDDAFKDQEDFLDFEKYFGMNEHFKTIQSTKEYFNSVSNKMSKSAKIKAVNVAKSALGDLLGPEDPKLELFREP